MLNNHFLTVNRNKMSVPRNAVRNRLLKLMLEIKRNGTFSIHFFIDMVMMINMVYYSSALTARNVYKNTVAY